MGFGLIFIGFIALMVVGVIYSIRMARKRREAFQQLAAEIGFAFNESADDVPASLRTFNTFNVGSNRKIYNTLTGVRSAWSRDVPIGMGDFSYVTESGTGKDRRRTTHTLSYLHARLPMNVVARLAVRKENVIDRIAGAIGFEDIDFESAEFSRAFHVSSDDRKLAYDLLDPRMIDWYMTSDAPTLAIMGRDVLLTDGRVWTPEQFRARLEWLTAFLERWPAHLLQRLDASLPRPA